MLVPTKSLCTTIACLLLCSSTASVMGEVFKTHVIDYQPTGSGPRSISLGDLDGDSDLDIMVAESAGNRFSWFENDGAASPSFTKRLIGGGRSTPTNIFSAHINDDEHLDVVTVSVVDDTISYYLNDGQPDPNWTHVIINRDPTPFGDAIEGFNDDPRMASFGDLDGDGDNDIAVSSVGDDKISWYENDNNGTSWTPHTLTDTLDGARAVWVADLNDDNHMDIIGGAWFSNTLYWYENDGSPEPNFTERAMVTFPENPNPLPGLENSYDRDEPIEDGLMWRMMTADMDNDGDTDVIAARRNQGVVEWYENDGGAIPQWTRHTVFNQYIAGKSIFPMDVNLDGHMDMVFAARGSSHLSWYENMGNGQSFTQHILFEGASPSDPNDINFGSRSVFGGDIDGDGDTDFAWAALSRGTVMWVENLTINGAPVPEPSSAVLLAALLVTASSRAFGRATSEQ